MGWSTNPCAERPCAAAGLDAGGRPGSECAARHERSNERGRGAQPPPTRSAISRNAPPTRSPDSNEPLSRDTFQSAVTSNLLTDNNFTYESIQDWAKLPEGWQFIEVSGVTVDS